VSSGSGDTAEPSGVAIHESDLAGIRSATQWLLAAFGGTALVVVAGIQFADTWAVVTGGGWRAWVTLAGLTLVAVGLFTLAAGAARVLVPDRTNLTDLLTEQAAGDAASTRVIVGDAPPPIPPRRDSAAVYRHVLGEVSSARGWLLPAGCADFDAAYQAFLASSGAERDGLRLRLREVAAFARAEAAFYRYRQLLRRLLGWAGVIVFAGLIGLVVALHADPPSNPVTEPIAVTVRFVDNPAGLTRHGVTPACAGVTASGVAVGGTLSEPVVIIGGTTRCPAAKVTITDDVGLAVPIVR
jgi:hypothetical protein